MSQLAFEKLFGIFQMLRVRHGAHNCVLVHGDCVGADAECDDLARVMRIPRHIRPCSFNGNADHSMRAHCERHGAQVIAEATTPMARNRAIAKECDVLIACPPTKEELRKGSGTWATIRYGRKYGKRVVMVFPDGTAKDEVSR